MSVIFMSVNFMSVIFSQPDRAKSHNLKGWFSAGGLRLN